MPLADALGGCVFSYHSVVVDMRSDPGYVVGNLGVDTGPVGSCTSIAVTGNS